MGLLDNITHQEYYQGNDYGSYQFVSLEDIINQFMVVYVGENKVIPKAKRLDVAFHAQRAMQELSFDTFKSVKSQQISLPPTLVMPLPHDYVGYTKLSWVDTSGIKHLLYPTNNTSNPFQIAQNSDGKYNFDFVSSTIGVLENSDFSSSLTDSWSVISSTSNINSIYGGGMDIVDGKLKTSFITTNGSGAVNWGFVHTAYQAIDVSGVNYLDISALGTADNVVTVDVTSPGVLRFGLSTQEPENNYINNGGSNPFPNASTSGNINTSIFDLTDVDGNPSYVGWLATAGGSESSTKELPSIDVSSHQTVYAVVVSYVDFTNLPNSSVYHTRGDASSPAFANSIDDLLVTTSEASRSLIPEFGNEKNSSTWNSYKAGTPSENQDDYQDDTYWPMEGSRYGLDPQQAQANGSFYIDDRLGRVHFSSNISGKTVILDYISDSLGTDGEMQVHKFAEEAMYKYISHAIISGSSYGQQLVPRLTKEKFAAIRKAKLRLSNIKLEELTQILRGKSKQIKH